jgi:hypothetical protein
VIAHLSLWQSTKMVAFYALVLVAAIALTAALLLNPEWGIAIAALGSLGD